MEVSDLILEYLDGNLDSVQAKELLSWVEQNPGNEELLFSLKEAGLVLNYEKNKVDSDTENELRRLEKNLSLPNAKHRFRKVVGIGIASAVAAMVGLFVGGASVLHFWQEPESIVSLDTGVGQHASTTLPDGSKVTLNACSSLSYSTKGWKKKREVSLKGEASFDVLKNEEAPFVVKASSYDVKVLGTSFNVSDYSEDNTSFVALKTGMVQLDFEGGSSFSLAPGQSCVYDRDTRDCRIVETEEGDAFAWEKDMLCFENKSLESMAPELFRHYGYTFVLTDSVKPLNYRATILDESLAEFLAILESITPQLRCRIDRETKTVYLSLE